MTVLSVPAGASIDADDVDRQRVRRRVEIDAAVGGAAVVLHLEREAREGLPLPSARRANVSLPAVMSVTSTNCPAVTAVPLVLSVPCVGQRRDLHSTEVVGRVVVRIAEAEVGHREGVRPCPPAWSTRLVGSRRRIVDARDVDGDRVGRRIEIDAAVGRAAVVLHLEGEAGVGLPLALAAGVNVQLAGRDVGDR